MSKRTVVVTSVLVISFISFLVFAIFLIFSLIIVGKRESEDKLVFDYNYLRLNPLENTSSSGFVSIFQELKKDEYISSVDINGNHELISNFGSQEYVCSGKCICGQNERRMSSVIVSRGVTYLLAAFTSVIAYQKAREHFDEECENILSEEESCGIVKSEIDSCENIEETEVDDESESSDGYPHRYHRYICRGFCVPRVFKNEIPRKLANEFGCENLKTEGEVEVEVKDAYTEKYIEIIYRRTHVAAYQKFKKETMTSFCKENSRSEYRYATRLTRMVKGELRVYRSSTMCKVYLCGSDTMTKVPRDQRIKGDKIHCRRTFPQYTPGNEKIGKLSGHWDD